MSSPGVGRAAGMKVFLRKSKQEAHRGSRLCGRGKGPGREGEGSFRVALYEKNPCEVGCEVDSL